MPEKIYHVAVEATLDVIGGKWKPVILCHLGGRTLRTGELTGELCQLMPDVSQRVLTRQLRELEADNIVQRKVYNQVPPKVEYSLTEEGKSLRNILLAMSNWGKDKVERLQKQGNSVEIIDNDPHPFSNME
ncbi:helix-turn-helix domain-containing protein [Pediococcus pentosaceus]